MDEMIDGATLPLSCLGRCRVAAGGLRLRKEANAEAKIVGQWQQGQELLVWAISADRTWWLVMDPAPGGQIGWSHSNFLMTVPESVA